MTVPRSFPAVKPGMVDVRALNHKRLAALRGMLSRAGYGACVLFDPFNQRWATGSRNMFLYFLRNATRYIYIPVAGPVISFDYPGSAHASMTVDTIDETRLAKLTWSAVQLQSRERVDAFGRELADLLREHAPGEKRVGVDRCSLSVARALELAGLTAVECQEDLFRLRMRKMPEEILCLKASMMATEIAVDAVRDAIRPGASEQKLHGVMTGRLVEEGGEFIENAAAFGRRQDESLVQRSGRASCSHRRSRGARYGRDRMPWLLRRHVADVSLRARQPTGKQQSLYAMAWDQIHHNMSLIKPGVSFREIADQAWPIPRSTATSAIRRSCTASACTARARSSSTVPTGPTSAWMG
jgi:Xaa-Pro aminopeptidase